MKRTWQKEFKGTFNSKISQFQILQYLRKTQEREISSHAPAITFENRSMPASVRVGFEKVKMKEDIPKPRQCHTCWKLGHAKKHCEGIPCCPICGTLTQCEDEESPAHGA